MAHYVIRRKLFDDAGRLIGYHDTSTVDENVTTKGPEVFDEAGRLIGYQKSSKKDRNVMKGRPEILDLSG